MNLKTCLEHLRDIGADEIPHGTGTLLHHLLKTYEVLALQEEDEDVCFAGLFHSIYGTKYFRHETTSDRNSIRKLIGERAERLAWKFCELDRNNFDWGDEDASDLYAIMEANKVSQNV